MEKSIRAKHWWRIAFVVYGVLSLSSMAGMGIGLGLFAVTTLWLLATSWSAEGKPLLKEVFSSPYSWASLALFLASLLSLLAAKVFPVEGSQAGPLLSSLKKFHYFIFPPLFAAAFLETSEAVERHPFWRAWMIFGAALGIVAIAQFFAADLFPASWLQSNFFRAVGGTNRFHGQGLMFFHLSFASCMCFVASAGWARVLFPLSSDGQKERIFWFLGAGLATLGVWFSYSRIAFAAVPLGLLFLSFLKHPRWGVGFLCLLLVTGPIVWNLSPSMRNRINYGQGGNIERFLMWKSAIAMFESRPLTGVGFSRTGELSPWYVKNVVKENAWFTSHAHNNVLDMLAATGLIGFLAFVAWWGFLFWAAISAFRRAPEQERWLPAAALMGFLAFQINGLTQVNFWDGKSEHTLMIWAGVALALWLREKKRAQSLERQAR